MEAHFNLTNEEFESQFRDCTLDPTLFTHEAHLRLAWIHLIKYGEEQAILNVCEQILAFDNTHGKEDKYNHTLTIAAVKAVAHFMRTSCADNFEILMAANPELKTNFKGLLASHYSINLFETEEARVRYLEPDLSPF